jgi:hypothetical protein
MPQKFPIPVEISREFFPVVGNTGVISMC